MTNKELLCLVAGAAIGSIETFLAIKDYYEKKYQEEIKSVKEELKKDNDISKSKSSDKSNKEYVEETLQKALKLNEKPDIMQYAAKLRDLRYTNKASEDVHESDAYVISPDESDAYVISPDDFGEIDDYEKVSLTYYQGDGVLADDLGEVVDEEIVGDALAHFGEYEDDSVFCRDDKKRCDYEILLDQRAYSSIAHPDVEG